MIFYTCKADSFPPLIHAFILTLTSALTKKRFYLRLLINSGKSNVASVVKKTIRKFGIRYSGNCLTMFGNLSD